MTSTEEHFEIAAGGARLRGTLVVPTVDGPAAAALLLNGSGPLDRDSNTKGQRLQVANTLAAALADRGVASLRFDKRGVGASEGDYLTTGFHEEYDDAAAALAALRDEPSIDGDRVVVIGHSVGATIAAGLVRAPSPPSAYVLLAGSPRTGQEVMEWQSHEIATTLGRPSRARAFERNQARLRARLLASTTDVMRVIWTRFNARWMREYMAHDPEPDLRSIDAPVLAITGSKDIQVDPADVARIGELVRGPFQGETPEDLMHVLRRDPDPPSLAAYRKLIGQPVDPWLVDRVVGWVVTTFG
jgi:pimeloyl-ACP methyl ester carboxylesterase